MHKSFLTFKKFSVHWIVMWCPHSWEMRPKQNSLLDLRKEFVGNSWPKSVVLAITSSELRPGFFLIASIFRLSSVCGYQNLEEVGKVFVFHSNEFVCIFLICWVTASPARRQNLYFVAHETLALCKKNKFDKGFTCFQNVLREATVFSRSVWESVELPKEYFILYMFFQE